MKGLWRGLALAGAVGLTAGCASLYSSDRVSTPATSRADDFAGASGTADLHLFYDELAPYGQWFTYGTYGWCWSPYRTPFGWRPYSNGAWVYTEVGWTWASNEPFGWATDHYGRWIDDDVYGWLWIPDTFWAPAWVAWRVSDDWIGWAPLPPGASWEMSGGLDWRDEYANRIDENAWCFVPAASFLDASVAPRVLPATRNRELLGATELRVRYDTFDGWPRNLGLDDRLAERAVGHRVPRYRLTDARTPRVAERRSGRMLPVFRPQLRDIDRTAPPRDRDLDRDERSSAVDAEHLRTRQAEEQRRLDLQYEESRQRLERTQREEERRAARTRSIEELRERHAAERQALDEEHERERRRIDARYQRLTPGTDDRNRNRRGGRP